ncbi:DUF2993 domain-containing protein [Microcoleus sp. FACHB-1515]|uniref:LmeA family phospholipid-binding protein n=1 Tax=Cyanophyceae TaxID=3028117 RepID=UPI0016872ED3|nr:DUF2993 domain-containing protein [Microcoleus sp. FACHB-1515]MBD2088692.1 DUF2993 domain-containing protein [Microcoleus sp. FACHB-1515]
MFGGLTGSKNRGTDLGERMLNAVASQSIRHLFTQSESVEVDIRCFPSSKLLQGSIDNFKMRGRNLVIRRQFEAAEISFETDAVSIDPGSVMGGKIRLKQPTQAIAQVTLTEDGINRAFKADLVEKRLQNVDMEPLTNLSGGEPVTFRDVQIELQPENRVKILAKTDLPNCQDLPIALSATIAVEKRRRVTFADAKFEADSVPEAQRGLSEIVTQAFVEILNNMVDFDRFDLDGVLLRVNRLETQGKNLVFSGYAQIERFPGT